MRTPGTETPINTSVQTTASFRPHLIHHFPFGSRIQAVLVMFVSISFVGFSLSLPA